MIDGARITVTVYVLMKDGSTQSTRYTADTSIEPFKIEESIGEPLIDKLSQVQDPSDRWPRVLKPIRLKIDGLVFCLERNSTAAPTPES